MTDQQRAAAERGAVDVAGLRACATEALEDGETLLIAAEEVLALLDALDQARARVAGLETALESLQWWPYYDTRVDEVTGYYCMGCDAERKQGHAAGCRIAAALASAAGEAREHVLSTECWCHPHVDAYGDTSAAGERKRATTDEDAHRAAEKRRGALERLAPFDGPP